jgi:cation diffusion facilitator CzcD-associated flavoprotein CzcO
VRPAQLVLANGAVSGIPKMPRLPGLDGFGGAVLHSTHFTSGTAWQGKRAVVVGTGNSGHDVAQDLYSDGAEVTMVQRSPTCVVSLVPSGTMVYALYSEGPAEDIDLITAAIPYPVLHDAYQWLTRKTCELDRDLLDRLHAAGFRTDFGADNTGFHMKYLRQGGGYYINVGCSDLIADRKIGLVQAHDIDAFTPAGLRLRGGTEIGCDLVVLATGYENQQESIRRFLGDEVAARVGPVWGHDGEGFMNGMWRRTGQPGLWLMGGALMECRLWSRFLALQIKATLAGTLPAGATPVSDAGTPSAAGHQGRKQSQPDVQGRPRPGQIGGNDA